MRKGGNNTPIRCAARDEALKRMWVDIYRQKMRRSAKVFAQELDLDDVDVQAIEEYYHVEESNSMPIKWITINFAEDVDMNEKLKCLERCLKKCYVQEWAYCFEFGKKESHPHYHVIVRSAAKWLDDGRIIREWSKVFDIERQYVECEGTSSGVQKRNLTSYSKKEGLVFKTSRDKLQQEN